MKRFLNYIAISCFVAFFSCNQTAQADYDIEAEPEFDFSSFCDFPQKTKDEHFAFLNFLKNNNIPDSLAAPYLIDNQEVTPDQYMQRFEEECYPLFYTTWIRDSLGTKPYRPVTKSYSQEYFVSNLIEANYVELTKGDNDILFLSINSAEVGPLNTRIYDLKSGESMMGFSNTDYDGNYYLGHSMKGRDMKEVRVIYMIGDDIGHKDFFLEPYNTSL